MMDKDITDPSFKYAPSQNPIDPLKTSGSAALPNTMAQQVDFVPSGDDFADTIAKQTRQRIADQTNAMNLAISKAAAGNADEAAAAQRLGYETGVGADIAARNMKALQERVAVDRIGQLDLMRADPVLAKMLSDQNFAAIAHDDVDNLQSTGTMLDSVMGVKNEFLLGRERGYATTALGKTGGKMLQDSWLGKPLLEADRAEAKRQVAEMEKMRGSGGFAESFGALEGQMESGLPQQIEMAGVGAVAGGAILGLPSGGLGLVPGMVAGAELGFLSASAVQSFEIESGASFVDLLDQDIPEDTARTAATIVGTINAALEMIPLKFFTSRAKSLIKSTVQEQVVSSLVQVPGIKNAVGKFVKEWTMGIGVESVTEVVQELTNMWGEDFSKYQTDPDFQAKMTTPAGRMEVANRLLSTFEEVAKGMAVMGFIMPGANFALDAKRARKANKAKQFFKDIGKDAAASKVRERNPNSYQAWFAARAKGTGAETIYVDVDKVRGAMVKNGINQEQLQFLLPDLYKQLQAIGANSGVDVTIPTSVYAARLVDTAFGQDLQSDMRLNPDDMSINDNNEYVKTRDRRVAELVKLSDEMTASDEILAESAKVVENRVVAEIMAVGKYTELEAKAMAAAHVAFAVVNAPEFGMTPDQFDTQYGMATRGEGQAVPAAPLEQASRIDAKYMEAVERGDMEIAQRMVDKAAKDAGFNEIGTHGLSEGQLEGDTFDKQRLGSNTGAKSASLGFFFGSKMTAMAYAKPKISKDIQRQYATKLQSKWNELSKRIPKKLLRGFLDMPGTFQDELRRGKDAFFATTDINPITKEPYGESILEHYSSINDSITFVLEDIETMDVDNLSKYFEKTWLPEFGALLDEALIASTESALVNVRLKMNNPYVYDYKGAQYREKSYASIISKAKKNGHDSVILKNTYDGPTLDDIKVVFEPSQIKSADPITRDAAGNVIPLYRRFNIASTSILEQAAMAEPAAESVEAVQETAKVINEIDQQIKDEGNTDVNTKTIDEVVFDDRIPIITLQDLVGKTLFPTIADRTAAGAVFTGVDSSKLEVAMELLGGPFFPLRQSNLERGVVWANRGKGVITKKEQLVKGGAKYMVVVLGDVNMHQSNTTVTNAFLALTSAYIRDGRINKENADKLSGLVKNAGVDKESKTRKDLQQFPGFDDLKVLNTYIQKMSFESRKVMLDVLGGAAAFNLGAPSMQKILDATIEPSLAGNRWGDATLVLEIDESQSFIKLGTEGTREHPDYPLGIRGRVVGRFATPINYEHIWKEWFAKTAAQPVKTTKQPSEGVAEPKEKTRQNINRGFDLAKPIVTVTQELADSVGSMTGGNIDGPRQAELATAMVLNKWAVGGVTKVEGGASPQMFVYEVANSEAFSVLNEYTKKEVTDGIKKKTFQIYQLNDQKSRIWFATKVGNLGTEYGVQVPELSDSDIALTAVINNEQGARGIAGPAVVLKALEEGVTCLDCFAIKSEKHPIGFLPTLYAEFGFEIVATVPFDSKYYTPTRLKDAENYWAETGWNKERDGYPDVVIMKWRGTEDDRANVTRRYLRDGTTSILAEGIAGVADTNAQVAYNNDQSRLEEQREVADSGTGRGIQGNTRRSLASRALGVAESIAGLTDEQASNYGISLADRDAVKKSIADARVLEQAAPSPGRRGSFDPTRFLTTLNTKADLSTFLHESSHFFFSVYTDIASRPGAPARIAADVQILLDSFGVKDIAAWNAMTFEEQRKYQEQFAYNFEIYLFEGKAPSIEMQGLFERFSKWLRRVYTSISTELNDIYRREFGEDLPILTDEIRGVMGRMLASEAQIKRAEAVNEMKPQFQTQAESGMDDARWAAYQAMIQEAHDQAVTDLTKASLRQMEWLSNARSRLLKNMQSKHDEIRKEMRAEIEAEVMAEPLYMAMSILKTGQGRAKNGELVQFNDKFKLNLEAVKKMLPSEEIAKLGYGKYGMVSEDGIPPDMVAEIVGFVSGDELVLALLNAKPAKEEIAARLDKRMMDTYGKMNTPEAREAAVQAAIHNEARERFVAVEARFIAKATQPVRVMIDAAKAAARQIVGAKKIDDISPGEYAAAEARASRDAAEAYKDRQTPDAASKSTYTRVYNEQIAKGVDEATAVAEATRKAADASTKAQGKADAYKAKYGDRTPEQVIIRAKQAQVLQNQLVKEATSSLEEVDTAVKDFRKFFGSDEKIAKGRNMDLVDAARSILAFYGLGKHDKLPSAYTEKLQAYNPEMYEAVRPIIEMSQQAGAGGDYETLTVSEFRMMREVVDALWEQSRRDKQAEIAGKMVSVAQIQAEFIARTEEIGIPADALGSKQALTENQKRIRHLMSAGAVLQRVENWARRFDGPQEPGTVGPATKYIWRPIKNAVTAYKIDKNKYVKKFVELLNKVDLPVGKFRSDELDYTFGVGNGGNGKAELLGAMLHMGNESNLRKLLVGRGWGSLNADGTLDTSRWDAFVERMINEGKLTKEDFEFLQATWDLLEEIKPIAQKAHRDLYGYYFNEIEAKSFTNRFGTYRGGYVPAKTDAMIVRDAQRQAKMEELEADFRASMPSTGMGFTMGRVEYNEPLSMDVRLIEGHIDSVLRFSHIQPAIKDVLKIIGRGKFADNLTAIQPFAINDVLLPWLNRTARQTTSVPGIHPVWDKSWNVIRKRTGIATMMGNLRNAMQQFTGWFPAALLVNKGELKNAMSTYLRNPMKTAASVASLSPFMNDYMNSQIFVLQDNMNELLINPSKYARFKNWTDHHSYFLQTANQNIVNIVTWLGKYNQVLSEIDASISDSEAQYEAVQQADAAVRLTQGGMSPEDVARFQVGTPFDNSMTQFMGFFNMTANLNADEFVMLFRDLGWRGNKGKLMMIYILGIAAPALVSDAISRSLGQGWDDDDDGYLDDVADWFFGSQARYVTAFIPFGSAAYTALTTAFNDKPYDDRITSSPSITSLEASTVGVGKAIINIADDDKELTGRNVRDVLTLITNATGVPVSVLGRPIGYQVDVERGKIEPTDPIDYMRGLITGVPSAESKKK